MIIGIDDSGDFDDDRLGFFVAVFIRPKKHRKIGQIFQEWEATLPPDTKDKNGEVKGYKLSNSQLLDFAETILQNNIYGIRFRAFAISTLPEVKQNAIGQRDRNVKQYEKAIQDYRKQGTEYYQIAAQYTDLKKWLSKRSTKTLLKIELLGITIIDSLNWAIIYSTKRNFSRELADLQFKIDKAFIGKPENLPFWKDIVRTQLWHFSYTEQGIIHIANWNSHHPFVKKFYDKKSDRTKGIFTPAFKQSIDFYDSSDNFEVRIADIIASAIFRRDVKGENLPAVEVIMKANLKRRPYTVVLLTNEHVSIPNPYTDKIS
jgi:hypothetical protein